MSTTPRIQVAIVAEDDAVRDSTAVLLNAVGGRVLVYPSAEALLADAESQGADRLVLHQASNGRSGLDVLRRLRRRGVSIPAILIAPMKLRALSQELSVDAVLEGPVMAKDLLRLLQLRP